MIRYDRSASPAAPARWLAGGLALLAAVAAGGEGDPVSACLQAEAGPAQVIADCTAASEVAGLAPDRHAAVLVRRGLARMASRDLEGARQDLDAAIRLDAGSPWAYNSRGVVWMQQGDPDQAIADYEHAVQLAPKYGFAWANLGNARLMKGDADQALADLGKSIQLDLPHVELAYTGRGKVWLAKGDYGRAREDFDAALQANPNYANALSGRAFAYFCQGNFEAAAADFRSERRLRRDSESAIDLVIAMRRGGHDGQAELAAAGKEIDQGQGMPAGLALFMGTITPEQALQASADRDPRVQRLRSCAASFEVGEWYLLRADLPGARHFLQMARQACDVSQRAYAAAGAELSRLDPH